MWSFRFSGSRAFPEGIHRTYDFNERYRAAGINACHYQLHVHADESVTWKMQPEMEPRPENRVVLAYAEHNGNGCAIPDLHFGFSDRDRRTVTRAREFLLQQAKTWGIELPEQDKVARWRSHPAGTCRMGFDETNGVVDRSSKVFRIDNLYLSGATVFPTSGTSNPTLTVVALTLRLADHLVATLSVR